MCWVTVTLRDLPESLSRIEILNFWGLLKNGKLKIQVDCFFFWTIHSVTGMRGTCFYSGRVKLLTLPNQAGYYAGAMPKEGREAPRLPEARASSLLPAGGWRLELLIEVSWQFRGIQSILMFYMFVDTGQRRTYKSYEVLYDYVTYVYINFMYIDVYSILTCCLVPYTLVSCHEAFRHNTHT